MVGCLTWDGGSHGLLCSVHGEDATGIEVWAKPRGMWYALLKNKGVSQSGGQAERSGRSSGPAEQGGLD